MARINKSDLVQEVAKHANSTVIAARIVVDAVIKRIEANLDAGNEVAIQDFGTFKVALTPARTMVDHLHGKGEIHVPAGRRVKFTPSKNLLS